MKNFGRVLRMALVYRGTLAGILISSLIVGVLWGANIGIVYPFVEVIFSGQSMHQWIDGKIENAAAKEGELHQTIAELRAGSDAATGDAATGDSPAQLQMAEARLLAEQQALQGYRWLQPLIHNYLPTKPFSTLLILIGFLVLATIIKDFMLVLDLVLVERLNQLTLFDLRKLCFRTTLKMDLKSFSEHSTSALMARFTADAGAVGVGITQVFGNSIREPMKMLACVTGASLICWRLLLFSLLLAPPAIYLIKRLSQSIKRANRRALEEVTRLFHVLSEAFSGIQTVKAYNMERWERNRFHGVSKQLYAKSMRITFYNALTKPITELLGIGVISVALLAGTYLVLNQETHLFGIRMCDRPLSFASLLLFYGLLAGVSDPARKMTDIYGGIQGAFAAADRLFAVLDIQPEIVDAESPRPVPQPFREIVFDRVSFHYQADQPVLRDCQLRIEAGEKVALVGPNGCGKTSLLNLLLRFYDPVIGSIRVDDVDLRAMRLRDLRGQIGLVTQHTQLFNDTVLNNIRYGSPQATEAQVIAAAKQAHAHQFIMDKLENGYATVVGQGGSRLSGGQRQRIALARAILKNPAILILDEATSQVDIESEHLIHKTLETFIVDRTAIFITHRLSTLDLVDRIVVMDAGRILDCGTHEELVRRCELYRRLHEIQFRQTA
ncbi:MAG: ABC transporter ATP-binding protein [Planctomycetota bacterium]